MHDEKKLKRFLLDRRLILKFYGNCRLTFADIKERCTFLKKKIVTLIGSFIVQKYVAM